MSMMSIIIIVRAACFAGGVIGAIGANCGLKLVGRISVPLAPFQVEEGLLLPHPSLILMVMNFPEWPIVAHER